ncbi:MAG TPA: prepilin peptidase [Oligoflexia bacterium]|nr:prepilin peptidase [Oligoflexia bacterium]HMP48328.1 prepilin peptidase [Oligoflexia bacterium]
MLPLYITALLLGLIIGSFLNVLIYRLPRKISVLDPVRSFCPECNTQIAWYDNIPVIGWLILGGKCRSCKAKISPLYPFIEICSGILAISSLWFFGVNETALLCYLFFAILLVITVIDLQFMIIPDRINKPGMVFGLLIGTLNQFTNIFSTPITNGILDSMIGGTLGFGLLYIIAWIYFKTSGTSGLGGGDIKLMGFTGTLLGFESIFPSLLIASLTGVVAGVLALTISKKGLRTEIPFGPWLALGIACHMFGLDPVSFINKILIG